ncbi:unnamed protein product [Thelazia callipaeda]|uniref:Transmembrane protein n=1 Tax=Thelazia callipaeda TaxID=103827 RepID=A0A0N5CV43_THECL|nr:unnamed protein product [Thelazia callipaeda]
MLIGRNYKSSRAMMTRPSTRHIRFFWELIIAFMMIVSAAVLQTFQFFNNAWLVHNNGSYVYQRGLGDDCVKNNKFSNRIKCSGWWDNESTFIISGQNLTVSDVVPPSMSLRIARVLMSFSIVLYLLVAVSLFFTCIKRNLKVEKFLCGFSVLLGKYLVYVLTNLIIVFLVIINSSEAFIKTLRECSLGSAFYYFLLSYFLLCIGSITHFDSWMDVYVDLRARKLPFEGFFLAKFGST